MKTAMNWKWLVCLGCMICALATTATAQPNIDLELTSVEVVVTEKGTDFQIRPIVTIRNHGHLAAHALDMAMQYGPIAAQIVTDTVTYIQENNDCLQSPITNCNGGCLDIYLGLGWMDGFCADNGIFYLCGCNYIIHKEFEWVTYVAGYESVTIQLDPENLVDEIDETNNEITINLAPVANESKSWTSIKSMYR